MKKLYFFLFIICTYSVSLFGQNGPIQITVDKQLYLKLFTKTDSEQTLAYIELWDRKKNAAITVNNAQSRPLIRKFWKDGEKIKVLLRLNYVGYNYSKDVNYSIEYDDELNYISNTQLSPETYVSYYFGPSFGAKISALKGAKYTLFHKKKFYSKKHNNLSLDELEFSTHEPDALNNMAFSGNEYGNYLFAPFVKGWRGEKLILLKDIKKFDPNSVKYRTVDWNGIYSEVAKDGFDYVSERYKAMDKNDPMAVDKLLVETGSSLIVGGLATLIGGAFDAMYQDCEAYAIINSPDNKKLLVSFIARQGSQIPEEVFNHIYVYKYEDNHIINNTIVNIYKGHTSPPYRFAYNKDKTALMSVSSNETIIWNFTSELVTKKIISNVEGKHWNEENEVVIKDPKNNMGRYLIRENKIIWDGYSPYPNFSEPTGAKEFWFLSSNLPKVGNEWTGYVNPNSNKFFYESKFLLDSKKLYRVFYNIDKSSKVAGGLISLQTLKNQFNEENKKPITENKKVDPQPNKEEITIEDQLAKLKSLYEKGLITKEEYDIKRKEILENY